MFSSVAGQQLVAVQKPALSKPDNIRSASHKLDKNGPKASAEDRKNMGVVIQFNQGILNARPNRHSWIRGIPFDLALPDPQAQFKADKL